MLRSLINQPVGRYLVTDLLGRGGMAAVYRARDTRLQRDVALKVLYGQYGDDPSLVERFKREAITAAGLEHPNIVPVYDVGEQDGLVYIAMKLLSGRSLHDLLHERGTLRPDDLLPLLTQVAAALDYAHARSVIHRDIKPANLLLEGLPAPPQPVRFEDVRVLLSDFGIAKILDMPGLTTTGALIGTPDYMAPEQISNRRVDGRTDVYALGMLAFRALTGRQAFAGATQEVLMAHLTGAPQPPSMLNPQLSPAIDAVVLRAIAREPDDRYATAGAFVQALRQAMATPVARVAPPPTLPATRPAAPTQTATRPATRPGAPALHTQPTAYSAPPYRSEPAIHPRVAAPKPQPQAAPRTARSGGSGGLVVLTIALTLLLLVGLASLFAADVLDGRPNGSPPAATEPGGVIVVPSPSPTITASPTIIAPDEPTAEPTAELTPELPLPPTAEQTALPTPAPPTPAPPTPAPPTATPTAATPTATPTATATPTSPPTATPCPTVPMQGGFGKLYNDNVSVRVRLGCPLSGEAPGYATQQFFENGSMYYWRPTDTIYVLLGRDSGDYRIFPPDVVAALPEPTPADANAPVRGFGRIYANDANVRAFLGGWTSGEEILQPHGVIQRFANGLMLHTPAHRDGSAAIYVLYNDRTFERFQDPNQGS